MSINKVGQVELNSVNTKAYMDMLISMGDKVRLTDAHKPYSHSTASPRQQKNLMIKRWKKARIIEATQSPEAFINFIWARSLRAHRRKWKSKPITLNETIEIYFKQNGRCILSNILMKHDHGLPDSISMDRIDSSFGYTKDNVQLLALFINVGKGAHNNTQLLEMFNEARNHKK